MKLGFGTKSNFLNPLETLIIVKREPGLPVTVSPSFDISARNSHQMSQWRSMLLRMRSASKNLVEEKVPVFSDRVNKAKNMYVDYNPAKTTLDRYILQVIPILESPEVSGIVLRLV